MGKERERGKAEDFEGFKIQSWTLRCRKFRSKLKRLPSSNPPFKVIADSDAAAQEKSRVLVSVSSGPVTVPSISSDEFKHLQDQKKSSQLVCPILFPGRRKKALLSKVGCPYNLRPIAVPGIRSDESKHSWNQLECCEDVDEGSEASKAKYANLALNKSSSWSSFEFVETGPLAVGYTPTGRILHLNFKAKDKNEPGSGVQTFFAELTKSNRNVISVELVRCLGPSCSLPEKADTLGCQYCCSLNIHHPDLIVNYFRTGREDHWRTLHCEIKKLRKFISKCKETGSCPIFSHPGVKYIDRTFPKDTDRNVLYTTLSLDLYNGEKGTNFELVEPGFDGGVITFIGCVTHINFTAMNKDDPGAQLQTFFAEVIINHNFIVAVFCERLGPSNSLPEEADLHGCCFCDPVVHHPPGRGYLNGREHNPSV